MMGPDVSLRHLQRALTMELTTINTYLRQERQLGDWGVGRLAERVREETDEERRHAALLLTRILFLDGRPDLESLDRIDQPDSVRGLFETQHRMELDSRAYYAEAAAECRTAGDHGTCALFLRILEDEEAHVGFAAEQARMIARMGERLYVARHAVGSETESA